MATLTIRNLDNKTVERLKQHARQNGRSLQAEVRYILNNAAQLLRVKNSGREPTRSPR